MTDLLRSAQQVFSKYCVPFLPYTAHNFRAYEEETSFSNAKQEVDKLSGPVWCL